MIPQKKDLFCGMLTAFILAKTMHFNLEQLATYTSSHLIGNPHHVISNVADLETATDHDASFLTNPRYRQTMLQSKAGVIFIDSEEAIINGKNFLVCSNPSHAFQLTLEAFHPQRPIPSGFIGIHPSATIHPTVHLGQGITIGPQAVIDEEVQIGDRTFIGSGTYIGPGCRIENDCFIHPRVVIREQCIIGHHVIIQPGAVIGSCGFGYTLDSKGQHLKLNHLGNVILEEHVEIGANTTIDRARFKSTVIGKGTKIDNLVQIAHGVKLGLHNLIIAQTGIAGSTTTGQYVVLAGQVGVAGHLHLGDKVIVAAKSGVTQDLSTGKYNGIPAIPLADYNRLAVYWRQIKKYIEKINKLEKQIQDLSH
jgi:UDP-3-O-[3-hydroxymyristoyl] glucosamine N-acyltransferase